MKELFYIIWFLYVTIMCATGFFADPSVLNFLIAGFVWLVLVCLPGILFEKR